MGHPSALAFGEGACLVDLAIEGAPDRAARTHAAAAALRARLPGADVIVGAGTVLVVGASAAEVNALTAHLDGTALPPSRLHSVVAAYDGPDLEDAAAALGIAPAELVERHAAVEYTAELLGFLPGFAYLGPIDPRLVLARRPSPRPAVHAYSIGIAGGFTGIYPFTSPGGWNLIARALDTVLFDPAESCPVLLQPGDRVRFVPSAEPSPPPVTRPRGFPQRPQAGPGLVVISAQAGATVQDAGRAGRLGQGIPPSGPLDREVFDAANAAVGNAAGAAAIEVPLGGLEVEAQGEIHASIDGALAVKLAPGARLRVPPVDRAVRYLAVRGGIAVPEVMGARATLLVACVGGLDGRTLVRGDVLPVGTEAPHEPAAPVTIRGDRPDAAPLAIEPGPFLDRFPADALDALLAGAFQVSRLGDRLGVRLEGARVPRDREDLALPVPMRRGAIQVATDGTPIVLGPDHPTTGGYPVLAVLTRDAQDRLARRRPGDPVRFALR